LEQLYPVPEENLKAVISSYPNLHEAIWLQEEPWNMGAWTFIAPRLQELLPDGIQLTYLGRSERASTAEGDPEAHQMEQTRILEAAFGGERGVRLETVGVHDVS
jgi:2-oxoglutarate dehydrogenase E1 component